MSVRYRRRGETQGGCDGISRVCCRLARDETDRSFAQRLIRGLPHRCVPVPRDRRSQRTLNNGNWGGSPRGGLLGEGSQMFNVAVLACSPDRQAPLHNTLPSNLHRQSPLRPPRPSLPRAPSRPASCQAAQASWLPGSRAPEPRSFPICRVLKGA